MKKSIKALILAALLAAAIGAQAQYSADYYHRVGDTVYTRSEIGYYAWWDFGLMANLRERIMLHLEDFTAYSPLVITPYFTPAPLQVVGMAGCLYDNSNSTHPAWRPEYAYLFDNGASGPVFLDSVQMPYRVEFPHRYLHLNFNNSPSMYQWDSCCVNETETYVLRLYESYFDTAVTVSDTFYVGWSHYNKSYGYDVVYNEASSIFLHTFVPCNDLDTFTTEWFSNCYFPWIDFYLCDDTSMITNPSGTCQWTHEKYPFFPLLYPLIQIDTTVPPTFLCEPVQNFQASVLDTGSGCVFFTWDDFLHYTYCEVQYYAVQQGFASASDTVVEGANMLHLCGLDTMMTYYARIRAFCDTSKIETDWSNWVSFSFPHTDPPSPPNPPQGVAEPSVLDQFTHVLPNPATDKVTAMSELGLRRIEVYNARGILVYSEPVGYSQASIDLRGWPAGQYMMLIETRQGKTAKRLVVAR